jgi:hypothetical protein
MKTVVILAKDCGHDTLARDHPAFRFDFFSPAERNVVVIFVEPAPLQFEARGHAVKIFDGVGHTDKVPAVVTPKS